jgi:WD40 repeat protein
VDVSSDAPTSKRYDAFVSYSHAADGRLAPALQSGLQRLAKAWYRLRAMRVFRDETDLSATPEVWPTIESALDASRYLVLMASPEAAGSKWVEKEAEHWVAAGKAESLLIVLTDGEIAWDEKTGDFDWGRTTALPGCLSGVFGNEPLWVDLRAARTAPDVSRRNPDFLRAVARLSAPIRGMDLNELVDADYHEHRRTVRTAVIAVIALGILTALSVFGLLQARAQRRTALAERDRADEERDRAVRQERIATVRRLAAESGMADRQRVRTALVLEAYRRATQHGLRVPVAEQALRDLVGAAGVCDLRGDTCIAFSPDNRWLVTGCNDGAARLWNVVYYRWRDQGRVREEPKNGFFLDLWPTDNLGDLVDGDPILLAGHQGAVTTTVFTPDGKRLATGGKDGSVRIWNLAAAEPSETAVTLLGQGAVTKVMAVSPDGRWLAAAGDGETAWLWDLTIDNHAPSPVPLRGHTSGVWSIGISPDSRWLATGGRDGKARLWDLSATGPPLGPLILGGHGGAVMDLDFSPDGRLLATGGFDGSPRLWDLAAADPSATATVLAGGGEDLRGLAISPDGRWLAAGYHDTTARLWALADGGSPGDPIVLAGHTRAIWDVAFTPDSERLVTATDSGTLRLWDLTAPDPRATAVVLHGAGVGRLAVAASVWSLRIHDMIPLALRNGQGGTLSEMEWLRYFPEEKFSDPGARFGYGRPRDP